MGTQLHSTASPLAEKLLFTIRSFGQLQPTDASSKYLHAAVAVDELLEQIGCQSAISLKRWKHRTDGVVKLQRNAYTKQESKSALLDECKICRIWLLRSDQVIDVLSDPLDFY